MLLRYIVLHGPLKTEEDWDRYRVWKTRQLDLPECQMTFPEDIARGSCDACPGKPDCPKANRRR